MAPRFLSRLAGLIAWLVPAVALAAPCSPSNPILCPGAMPIYGAVGTANEIDLRASCGAAGNGVADGAAALKTCINCVSALITFARAA